MKYDIRELGIAGILDQTISMFKEHLKFILKLMAFTIIPASILYGAFLTSFMLEVETMALGGFTKVSDLVSLMSFMGIFALVLFVFSFAYYVCQLAIVYGFAKIYVGEEVTVRECLLKGLTKIPGMLLIGLIAFIPLLFGFMFLIAPGVLLVLIWYLIVPVYMLEKVSPVGAFGRSMKLMSGHKGKVCVLGLIYLAINFGISLITSLFPGVVSNMLSILISGFFTVFTSILVTIVYFSARSKVENYDLELLAQDVGGPERQSVPTL